MSEAMLNEYDVELAMKAKRLKILNERNTQAVEKTLQQMEARFDELNIKFSGLKNAFTVLEARCISLEKIAQDGQIAKLTGGGPTVVD